jgi:hypothetical protein
MSELSSTASPEKEQSGCRGCIFAIIGGITLAILFGLALGPIGPGIKSPRENSTMQQTRQIGLMMFSYANDHEQQYPDGKSSTEVFQKLVDGQYCSGPSVFYIPRIGKTAALPGQKLKSENVCFDVTINLNASSSDQLPVVFTTGYRVDYIPGGTAVPLKDSPQFNDDSRHWWTLEKEQAPWEDPGIAVAYKSNSARFLKLEFAPNGDQIISNFISPNYKPDGKTYQQLTPDGVLPQ